MGKNGYRLPPPMDPSAPGREAGELDYRLFPEEGLGRSWAAFGDPMLAEVDRRIRAAWVATAAADGDGVIRIPELPDPDSGRIKPLLKHLLPGR